MLKHLVTRSAPAVLIAIEDAAERPSRVYKTRQEAEEALDEYADEDVERCQSALGSRSDDGTLAFEV